MNELLMKALEHVLPPIAAGWAVWLFARRQTDAEVESKEINNLNEALKFYQGVVDRQEERGKRLELKIDELQRRLNESLEENRGLKDRIAALERREDAYADN